MGASRAGPGLIAGSGFLTLVWGTTWPRSASVSRGCRPSPASRSASRSRGRSCWPSPGPSACASDEGRREKVLWLVNGVLSFCLSYSAVYWSEQYIPSGLAAVLFATYPLFVAALAHFLLPGERLAPVAVVGMVLGFAGVAVIFSDDLTLLGGRPCAGPPS